MESYVQITEDNDNLTLTVAGVWKYNLDGSLITYKVDQLPESEGRYDPRASSAGEHGRGLPRHHL